AESDPMHELGDRRYERRRLRFAFHDVPRPIDTTAQRTASIRPSLVAAAVTKRGPLSSGSDATISLAETSAAPRWHRSTSSTTTGAPGGRPGPGPPIMHGVSYRRTAGGEMLRADGWQGRRAKTRSCALPGLIAAIVPAM